MIDLTFNNNFNFGPGEPNLNKDFRIILSSKNRHNSFDYLIFTDSKGTSIGDQKGLEWTTQILNELSEKNKTFLLITRPKELTVFFTLINFLELNKIDFKYLITNLGFVDLTPKKEKFINDIVSQNPFRNHILHKNRLHDYTLNSGETINLFNLSYSNVSDKISKTILDKFNKIFIIGTFEFNSKIKIERKRPQDFFNLLKETNKFIKLICDFNNKFSFINVNNHLPFDGHELSYDAVHFTQVGHSIMTKICKKNIKF
jgi:hypothetical protein